MKGKEGKEERLVSFVRTCDDNRIGPLPPNTEKILKEKDTRAIRRTNKVSKRGKTEERSNNTRPGRNKGVVEKVAELSRQRTGGGVERRVWQKLFVSGLLAGEKSCDVRRTRCQEAISPKKPRCITIDREGACLTLHSTKFQINRILAEYRLGTQKKQKKQTYGGESGRRLT